MNFFSVDVVSLSTNVPLPEVADIVCGSVCDDGIDTLAYAAVHFTKLLQFATSGEFVYKNTICKQVDDVAVVQRSSIAFLAHITAKWLLEYT